MALETPEVPGWKGAPTNPEQSGTGGGPPEGPMEHRLTALETRLDATLPMLATKGDVSEAKSTIVMWAAGIVFSAAAIIIAVMLFALNRVQAPPLVQPQLQPIVIQLPAATAPSSTEPPKK